jgi:hypothetical protein
MPYNPTAPTEKERSGAYHGIWLGFAANIVLVIAYFGALPFEVNFLCLLLAGTWIVLFNLSGRFDDYLYTLRNEGLRWSVTFVGLWLLGWGLVAIGADAHEVGVAAASGRFARDMAGAAPPFMADGYLMMILTSLAFYAGAAFAWARGR